MSITHLQNRSTARLQGFQIPLREFAWPVLGFLVLLVVLWIVRDQYWTRIIALIGFWAVVGTSWNLIGGYAGQPSFGHAAFVGIGAYTTVILLHAGIVPWLGIPCGVLVACVAAAVIGYPTLRLRDVYFALATLVYPLILSLIVIYLGLQEVLVPAHPEAPFLYMSWIDPRAYALLFGLIGLIAWLGLSLLERSRYRLILQAIRQDEDAARSAGIDTPMVKLFCFVASAALAALAGGIYIQLVFVVTPSVMSFDVSIQAILIALVGGFGKRGGGFLGALILIPIANTFQSLFSATSGGAELAYGLALMIVVIAMPRGLIDQVERMVRTRRETGKHLVGGETAFPGLRPVLHVVGSSAATPDLLLKASGLTKAYGGVVALSNVDFSIQRGEFVGLVGPNGAGKSTLFDLLTGYQRPTGGRIEIGGKDATRLPSYGIARLGLRRTFQSARPFVGLSVLDNVLVGCAMSGRPTKECIPVAQDALLAVGLEGFGNVSASALTPSQLRLLEVARALASDPEVLLLDEPLAGLTLSEMDNLLRVLRELNEKGLTIVIVDHNVGSVARTVSRMVVLDRGNLIANDVPDRVMRDPRVVGAYLGSSARAA
jgi:branched-chain amino acid transport system permease protein